MLHNLHILSKISFFHILKMFMKMFWLVCAVEKAEETGLQLLMVSSASVYTGLER